MSLLSGRKSSERCEEGLSLDPNCDAELSESLERAFSGARPISVCPLEYIHASHDRCIPNGDMATGGLHVSSVRLDLGPGVREFVWAYLVHSPLSIETITALHHVLLSHASRLPCCNSPPF